MTRLPLKLLCFSGLIALVLSGCSGTSPTTTAQSNISSVRHVYVAVGENGSNSARSRFDPRFLWTQLFYQSAVGTEGTFFDLTSPNETIANVTAQALPQALAEHPDLVTVWASAADISSGTSPPLYEQELSRLVRAFRMTGAIVLLANVSPPALDPAIGACADNSPGCQAESSDAVSAYDAAIAVVAHTTGARLVDLHRILSAAITAHGLAGLTTTDRRSLSSEGAALVVNAFRAMLPKGFATFRRP